MENKLNRMDLLDCFKRMFRTIFFIFKLKT